MSVVCFYKLNGQLYCLGAESGTGEVKVVPYGILENKEILAAYISAHSGVIPHFRIQVSHSCTVKCEVFTGQ